MQNNCKVVYVKLWNSELFFFSIKVKPISSYLSSDKFRLCYDKHSIWELNSVWFSLGKKYPYPINFICIGSWAGHFQSPSTVFSADMVRSKTGSTPSSGSIAKEEIKTLTVVMRNTPRTTQLLILSAFWAWSASLTL